MLCSLCGHDNPSGNRFCGMCGMPMENAVFKPKLDAVPPVDAESEAKENAHKEAARKIAEGVPSLWNRVLPEPLKEPVGSPPNANLSHGITSSPLDAGDAQKTRRAVTAELEAPVAVSSRSSSPPRDEVRERLSTMFDRSRPADRKRTTVSVLGLDVPQSRESRTSERESSTSGPTSISGPSFLGLDSEPPSADYLLEDENSGHGRAWLVVTVIVILALLLGLQWRTEVQAQARRVAAIVKARMQPPAVKTEEASATSSDVKTPSADGTTVASPATDPTSTTPPSETAKATGDDQNPVKGAATEQPSSAPAAAPQPGKDPPVSEGARSEKAIGPKDPPAVANKQAPEAEQQSAAKSATTKDRAATSEPAKEQAVDDSSLMMAQKYLQGQGVPRSCEQGMVYLKQAVRQPSPRARSQMGALYATGTCVPQNRVEAYRWFSSALDLDPQNPWLARERDMLYGQMTSAERQSVNQ